MTDTATKLAGLIDIRDRTLSELEIRARYKIKRYFHDCLPGCKIFSPRFQDHVPLIPGNPPTCRVLYVQSLQFFRAAAKLANGYPKHQERLYLAANRIGKTETAGFEVRNHLTGDYPKWWPGYRFDHPNHWWAAGDTMLTTRDIIQRALLGPHEGIPLKKYEGMIESHLIESVTRKSGGVTNCVDTIYVQHVEKVHGAPALSSLQFLSYDMGRRVFQGVERDGIWLDEEPPDGAERAEAEAQGSSDIYTECLLRLMTTKGLLISTFTPLRGLTPFLVNYLDTAVMPNPDDGEDVEAKSHFYPDLLGAHDGPAA